MLITEFGAMFPWNSLVHWKKIFYYTDFHYGVIMQMH